MSRYSRGSGGRSLRKPWAAIRGHKIKEPLSIHANGALSHTKGWILNIRRVVGRKNRTSVIKGPKAIRVDINPVNIRKRSEVGANEEGKQQTPVLIEELKPRGRMLLVQTTVVGLGGRKGGGKIHK